MNLYKTDVNLPSANTYVSLGDLTPQPDPVPVKVVGGPPMWIYFLIAASAGLTIYTLLTRIK